MQFDHDDLMLGWYNARLHGIYDRVITALDSLFGNDDGTKVLINTVRSNQHPLAVTQTGSVMLSHVLNTGSPLSLRGVSLAAYVTPDSASAVVQQNRQDEGHLVYRLVIQASFENREDSRLYKRMLKAISKVMDYYSVRTRLRCRDFVQGETLQLLTDNLRAYLAMKTWFISRGSTNSLIESTDTLHDNGLPVLWLNDEFRATVLLVRQTQKP